MSSSLYGTKHLKKIQKSELCMDLGELKLIYIKWFLNVVKSTWVKSILDKGNEGIWKYLLAEILEKFLGILLKYYF